MELPLAVRELNRSARRPSTYLLRMAAPAVAFSVLGLYFQFAMQPEFRLPVDQVGRGFVQLELGVLILVVFLGLPFVGAVLIAQEKQERTLSLLMLADLSGRDIYAAKFLSVVMYGLFLVASGLPMLMLSVFFGAVTFGAILLHVALLLVAVAAICALSLFWSTVAPDPRTALFATFACLAGLVALSSYLEYLSGFPLNPLRILFQAPEIAAWRPRAVVVYVLTALAATILLALLGIRRLPEQVYHEIPIAEPRHAARGQSPLWGRLVKHDTSPMARLLAYAMAPPGFGAPKWRRPSVIGLCLLALITGPLMLPLLVVLIIFDVASNMRVLIVQGTLNDVRLLPVDDAAVAGAIHEAHVTRALPYLAPAVLSGVAVITAAAALMIGKVLPGEIQLLSWLLLLVVAGVYVCVCYWLLRCLVSLTCDCTRKEHRVARVTATAATTFAGYIIAAGYVGVLAVAFVALIAAMSPFAAPMAALLPLLAAELIALAVFRRTARDYQGAYIRLWARDIYAAADLPEGS
jgi:ABC-type transport system involved in multi-copper enzyme maturation permease subunit